MCNKDMDNVKRKRRFPKHNKKKKVLVFDENARREFLTGFHKRKLQRKAKAAEELKQQLLIEKKKLQMQTKKAYEKLMQSQKPIPEVEYLITKEIDMDTHSITVTELSAGVLAQKNHFIGINKVEYENDHDKESVSVNHDVSNNKVIEGMEIKNSSPRTLEKQKRKTEIKTQKDIKKAIKREATQLIQKNKVFKKKSRIAQLKDMKLKKREERRRQKLNKKK